MAAKLSNQAFCAVSSGIYIFLNRPSHSMLLVCMKIWSISLQSLYARNYPSHLYNLCHYALRLKNEESMHNSCIKIFCALPAATVTSSNGVSISSLLKQLGLGNCFAATNNIPSKTGCRHRLPPAALKRNSNIHSMAFTYCRAFNLDSAFLWPPKNVALSESLTWSLYSLQTVSPLTLCRMRSKYAFLTPCSKHSELLKAQGSCKSFLPHEILCPIHTWTMFVPGNKSILIWILLFECIYYILSA